MIRNLNQLTFQGFGIVPPERTQSAKNFDKNNAVTIHLSQEETKVCRAKTDTWVTCGSGSSVLSVSRDGENYQHYYLDKAACIKPDILFSLSAFQGDATVLMYAAQEPVQVGLRAPDTLRVESSCW